MRFLDRFPAFAPALLLTAAALLTTGCGPSQRGARHALAEADVPFSEAEFAQRAGAGDRDTLQLFFDAGMALNAAEEREAFPLIDAASGGHAEMVEMLLERGASPRAEGENGRTALIAAAGGQDTTTTESARTEIVQALLDAGADPNAVYVQRGMAANRWPRTVLYFAAENGYAKIAQQLLDAGARTGGRGNDALLLAAAQSGSAETLNLLLEKGDYPSDETTLVAMACAGKIDRVSRLLTDGVTPDAWYNGIGSGDTSALVCAAENGQAKAVQTLLYAGADPNKGTGYKNSQTALAESANNGHVEVVKALLDAGANPNAGVGSEGGSALGSAAESGYGNVVQLLLQAGADPDTQSLGTTPLEQATENGHTEVAKLLKDASARK